MKKLLTKRRIIGAAVVLGLALALFRITQHQPGAVELHGPKETRSLEREAIRQAKLANPGKHQFTSQELSYLAFPDFTSLVDFADNNTIGINNDEQYWTVDALAIGPLTASTDLTIETPQFSFSYQDELQSLFDRQHNSFDEEKTRHFFGSEVYWHSISEYADGFWIIIKHGYLYSTIHESSVKDDQNAWAWFSRKIRRAVLKVNDYETLPSKLAIDFSYNIKKDKSTVSVEGQSVSF